MREGIEAVGLAVPGQYVDMAELAAARGVAPGKYLEGIGIRRMAVAADDEDTVTLAVRAARQALVGVDVGDIGLCIVGTETAVDHSKPVASFVQGLLGLPTHCRVYETKHACYGGTAGLMTALDWIRSGSARGRKALIIASDIARYGVRTPGEPTQGAGAVALLVSDTPRLLELDMAVGTYSRDVMDFWRPLYSKDAVVDGQYSVTCYLEALKGAYSAWQELHGGLQPLASDRFAALAYHVPYPKMAQKAHEALRTFDGDATPLATFAERVKPGLAVPRDIGNIYTGSLYLSLLSLLITDPRDLAGQQVGLFSYGSGSCAEFFTGTVGPGAQAQARAMGVLELLAGRTQVSVEAYEHVMRQREGLDQKVLGAAPTEAFRFAGVQADQRVYSRA